MTNEVWAAIKEFGVGNLANELGISRQAISKWRRENRIPPQHFMDLDKRLRLETHLLALAIWPDA
tara:strand:+ start:2213 stop:2407 length:195 start_codon:yes stop_codon:yes gene_type:complete